MQTPWISILVPTRNNENDLLDCLRSIADLDYDHRRIEVIIWDNHSQRDSKHEVKSFLQQALDEKRLQTVFIEHDRNLGAFSSRDELLKLAGSDAEYILSIDDDVILPPSLLKKLLCLAEEDRSIGIIGPKIVYDDAPTETAHGAGFVNWWSARYKVENSGLAKECDYVIGCCMMIRKSVIDRIGGFDRDYYTSHGEVDFCLRARKNGYKVLYCPSIAVRHRVDRGGTHTLERLYYIYRNKLLVIRKNAPFPQKWTAHGLYALFWLPKALVDSWIRRRGINFTEIKTIMKAVVDGWIGRVGKKP
jgi:GT2 family glycosyltransferase